MHLVNKFRSLHRATSISHRESRRINWKYSANLKTRSVVLLSTQIQASQSGKSTCAAIMPVADAGAAPGACTGACTGA